VDAVQKVGMFCALRGLTALLGEFAELRKGTVSFVMSVRPHGIARLPLDRFSWNLITGVYFRKFVTKHQGALKSAKNNGYFTWRPMYIYDSIAEFFW